MDMRRYRTILSNRPYTLLLSSSVVSEAGDWAARLALSWLIYTLTSSVFAASMVLVVSVLPAALAGPWLAAATSTWSHRKVTIASDVVRAGMFALVAIRPSPVLALAVAAASGVVSVVFESHRSAWLPHVTGTDALGTAVSLAHALSDATVIIGYAIGGVLLGLLGVSGALTVNAVTFLISAVLLAGVTAACSAPDDDETPTGLRSAFATLRSTPGLPVVVGVATAAVALATGVEAVALPVLTDAGIPVGWTGAFLAAGAGLSLLITLQLPESWTRSSALRWVSVLSAAGFLVAAAGFATSTAAGAAVAVVASALAYVALVPANVWVTVSIPTHLRTSVFALLAASLAVTQSAAAAGTGAVVGALGTSGLVLISGLFVVAVFGCYWWTSHRLSS